MELKILHLCKDYCQLKETLTNQMLIDIDNVLDNYFKYQYLYDDGIKDIIGEFTQKYGNNYIIDWYEGMLSTEEFIVYMQRERFGLNV